MKKYFQQTSPIKMLLNFAITSLLALCFFSCQNEENRYIGDYYHSRQLYSESLDSELREEIVFSIYEDGTGYSYTPFESRNPNSHIKNTGAFTWESKKILDNNHFFVQWKNGERTSLTWMKGKQGKDILFVAIYDHKEKKTVFQVIGEKMTSEELKKESVENFQPIKRSTAQNLSEPLASWLSMLQEHISSHKKLLIKRYNNTSDELDEKECIILRDFLIELSYSHKSDEEKFEIYQTEINNLLSKHKVSNNIISGENNLPKDPKAFYSEKFGCFSLAYIDGWTAIETPKEDVCLTLLNKNHGDKITTKLVVVLTNDHSKSLEESAISTQKQMEKMIDGFSLIGRENLRIKNMTGVRSEYRYPLQSIYLRSVIYQIYNSSNKITYTLAFTIPENNYERDIDSVGNIALSLSHLNK